jgi:phage terminase large subunit-like protein
MTPTLTASPQSQRLSSSLPVEPPELDDFAEFCAELTLDTKRSMVLEPFQRRMLADYFSGTSETLIVIPKKNGKTTMLAALALYHLLTTDDAECYIAASSRDQAGIMLKQARKFIARNPDLAACMKVNQREIQSLNDEGFIRVLAADEDTADGVIPTLALVDELHRHKKADLYGVFRDGLGPRGGRMITISTAGDDEDSPLGRARAAYFAFPVLERCEDERYMYARNRDASAVLHEWSLRDKDDRDDLEVVALANPASWQTVEALRRRFESPLFTPWGWARFACGVWLQGEDTALSPVEWADCAYDGPMDPAGAAVRIGLDVGWTVDTTAVVAHWLDDAGVAWIGDVEILKPDREGESLRKQRVLAAVQGMCDRYGSDVVVLDPENEGMVVAQDLQDVGLRAVAYSQRPGPMAMAAERFAAAVRERKLRHPNAQPFTRQVLNARVRSTDDGRWRFVKETKHSKKHIDALIAAAMVHSVAIAEALTGADFFFAFSDDELEPDEEPVL